MKSARPALQWYVLFHGSPLRPRFSMSKSIAIVGAGVSGLTCGVVFAEAGYSVSIFAEELGERTTSAAAGAIWFPYDCEPRDKVIAWALETYRILVGLAHDATTGVSMIQLCQYSRTGDIQIPDWASSLGARVISPELEKSLPVFSSIFKCGFVMNVPLMDTTIYLDYLADRFRAAGGEINAGVRFDKLEDVNGSFEVVINCAGIGARALVSDVDLESHRGQVAIVAKNDNLSSAIVCDDAPLVYLIPRTNDCVLGGTNELSDNLSVDPTATSRILAECTRVVKMDHPRVLGQRVGLRPFRKSGVCLERDRARSGRTIIHNYGHGGSGFTLSWGCGNEVFRTVAAISEMIDE
jgi:D-amino-acid oxidase